jgi:hypothetical protein
MADEPVASRDAPVTTPSIPQPPRTYEFTTEQLTKFFNEKWKDVTCEICKEVAWTYNPIDGFVALSVTDGINNGVPSALINVSLRIHCTSCGNQKLLLAPIIKQWLADHP